MIELKVYRNAFGKEPFTEWLNGLRSKAAQARIATVLMRLQAGNAGDCKSIGHGVQEIRVHMEAGYRVFFGHDGQELVIILAGSDKSDQKREIIKAIKYWQDYKRQKAGGSQHQGG
ncbi:MAG: addiction module killer protein [Micavibrio sp.]|nr:addiction module killer protein [Micavibrio sp.]